MDYEKKYKEALEVAQKLYQDCPNGKNDRLYHTTDLEKMFPELRESEDEKIRKELIEHVKDQQSTFISAPDCRDKYEEEENNKYNVWIAWLEKQGEKKPTQEIKPFEAEHGKYYYCIKDYFCGGRKQASKGDVVQALRGLPIMGLKDASEYFLPVNFIKCNSAWSEDDEEMCQETIDWFEKKCFPYALESENPARESIKWLKSLKNRVLPQPKQEWSEDDKRILDALITSLINERFAGRLEFLKGIKVSSVIDWLKSLKEKIKKEAV